MFPSVAIDSHGNLTIENFGRNPEIPVTFMHQGKRHKGYFSESIGMGGYYWELYINRFYRGTMGWMPVPQPRGIVDLSKQRRQLRFWSHHGDLDYLGDDLIESIVAWYQ